MNPKRKKLIGGLGERLCCKYLKEQGYQILDQNFRRWGGEIDIIARDTNQDEIAFVEVKTRLDTEWFDLDQTLSEKQIYHIKSIAKRYLFEKGLEDTNWRIDHVAILLDRKNTVKRLEHFEVV